MNNVVIKAIPQEILNECPLHDGDAWQHETNDVWAAIRIRSPYDEDTYAFCWITRGAEKTTAMFQADNKDTHFPPNDDGFIQALRYAYAMYLFASPNN